MSSLRVVLDTNVLVSGLAYPASIPGRILLLWHQGALDVVLSRFLIEETARVLPRLSRIQLTTVEIRDLTDSLMFMAEMVEPVTTYDPELRDSADQQMLATLLASNADFLVTGDKDLLVLAAKYPILSPAAFWARHQ